jgi:hypothetical protein
MSIGRQPEDSMVDSALFECTACWAAMKCPHLHARPLRGFQVWTHHAQLICAHIPLLQASQGRPHVLCDMRLVDDAGRVLPNDGSAVGDLQVWSQNDILGWLLEGLRVWRHSLETHWQPLCVSAASSAMPNDGKAVGFQPAGAIPQHVQLQFGTICVQQCSRACTKLSTVDRGVSLEQRLREAVMFYAGRA